MKTRLIKRNFKNINTRNTRKNRRLKKLNKSRKIHKRTKLDVLKGGLWPFDQAREAYNYYANLKNLYYSKDYMGLLSVLQTNLKINPLIINTVESSESNKYESLFVKYVEVNNNCIGFYKLNNEVQLTNILKLLLSVHLTSFATELKNFTDISTYLQYLPILDIFIKVNDPSLGENKKFFQKLSENMNNKFDLSDLDTLLAIFLSLLELPDAEISSDGSVNLIGSINYVLEILRYMVYIKKEVKHPKDVWINEKAQPALDWLNSTHSIIYNALDQLALKMLPQKIAEKLNILFFKFHNKNIDIKIFIKNEITEFLAKFPYLNFGFISELFKLQSEKRTTIITTKLQSGGGFESIFKKIKSKVGKIKTIISSTKLEKPASIEESIADIDGLFNDKKGHIITWTNYNELINRSPDYKTQDTLFDIINNGNKDYIILDKIIASLSIRITPELITLLNRIFLIFNKKCVIPRGHLEPFDIEINKNENFMVKLFKNLKKRMFDQDYSEDISIKVLNTEFSGLKSLVLNDVFYDAGFKELCGSLQSTDVIDYSRLDNSIGNLLLFKISGLPTLSAIITSSSAIREIIIKKLRLIFIKSLFNLNLNRILYNVNNILLDVSTEEASNLSELYRSTLNLFIIHPKISDTDEDYETIKKILSSEEVPIEIQILYNILKLFIDKWNYTNLKGATGIYKRGLLYNFPDVNANDINKDQLDLLNQMCLQLHNYSIPISSNILEEFLGFRVYDGYIFTPEINILELFGSNV